MCSWEVKEARVKKKKLVVDRLTLTTVNLQTPEFMRNELNF